MYLDRILGSKTRVNILSALVQNKDKSFMENELAKEIGSSVSEVNRQIKDLVNVRLVRMEKVGKAKVYSINKKYFLFSTLTKLFENLGKKYREIAKGITRHTVRNHRVHTIILFGSLAREKIRSDFVREPSDIDIVVIVEKKDIKKVEEDLIDYINKKISTRYGVVVYPIVLSYEEYVKGLDKDRFIMSVHSEGEVLYGEKPRKFG